jgi:glycosyltransferase involved in cell wall biosynthesis
VGLVSIILPVHDQADHLAGVVDGYREALARLEGGYELILVPNACKDETPAVCRELAARDPAIAVVELAEGGWGRALKAGLRVAQGDLLCYTNSARTQPEMLTLLLLYAIAYPEVVVKANRRIRDSWPRRLGSVIYNLQCRALFDLPTWDINGTPKVFPRSFRKLLDLRSDDDMIDAELMATCALEGYPIIEVPVLATVRHGGRSTTNYVSALRMYVGAMRLARRLRPDQ